MPRSSLQLDSLGDARLGCPVLQLMEQVIDGRRLR